MELLEDKYNGTIWGTDKQLTIIGHYKVSIPDSKYFSKMYVLTCIKCSKDIELFPIGSITSVISVLKTGANPCNCSSHTVWKEDQYKVLVKREAEK